MMPAVMQMTFAGRGPSLGEFIRRHRSVLVGIGLRQSLPQPLRNFIDGQGTVCIRVEPCKWIATMMFVSDGF